MKKRGLHHLRSHELKTLAGVCALAAVLILGAMAVYFSEPTHHTAPANPADTNKVWALELP